MWLHLSEDECLHRGDFAKKDGIWPACGAYRDDATDTLVPEPEAELLSIAPTVEDAPAPSATKPLPARSSTLPPSGSTSLFQPLDDGATSDSEGSESDINLRKSNGEWVHLALELDGLKTAAGAGKAKGKKGKGSGVVLETSEMRKVRDKMAVLEKDYMFSRKDAGE
jgi:ATP-dependent RNA helicase DHX29